MLILDTVTIFICTILFLLTALSLFSDIFFKKIREKDVRDDKDLKPVSVVIVADNNARDLKQNLDFFLSQDYSPGYEVIVAICKDEDGTGDVIEAFSKYENLHSTFVPKSSRYLSRHKLAITLGVKAAKNDLILLTDANCKPVTDKWIYGMSSRYSDDNSVALGYGNYENETSSFRIFAKLYREFAMMRMASINKTYGYDGKNIMFRKKTFLSEDGFSGNLRYLRGEYDFLANKYAKDKKVAVNLSAECFLTETSPSDKEWYKQNLFYMETRRHLDGKFKYRLVCIFNSASLYIGAVASFASLVYGIVLCSWLLTVVAVMTLFIPLFFRTRNALRVIRFFNADVPPFKIIFYEFAVAFYNLEYIIRYYFSDKTEFISHKI